MEDNHLERFAKIYGQMYWPFFGSNIDEQIKEHSKAGEFLCLRLPETSMYALYALDDVLTPGPVTDCRLFGISPREELREIFERAYDRYSLENIPKKIRIITLDESRAIWNVFFSGE
jgi:hypothetical protein